MNVFLTGASGFLGRHLLMRLLEEPDLYVYASSSRPEHVQAAFKHERLKIVKITDFKTCCWNTIDVLIHCAFPRNSNGINLAEGLRYTKELIEKAAAGNVKSVINISSQSVYSQKRNTAAEDDSEINLESTYAVGKYASELIVNSLCKDLRHTNLRLASLIGKGFDQRLPNRFIKKALDGKTISVKEGDVCFGFLDVRDAVNAIVFVVKSSNSWRESYNVGNGIGYSPLDLAKKVAVIVGRVTGIDPEIQIKSGYDQLNTVILAKALREDFNWLPQYTLDDSIHDILLSEVQSRLQ